jgi:ADP-ribose pyrophosphatase YjhB (NUDIX family)
MDRCADRAEAVTGRQQALRYIRPMSPALHFCSVCTHPITVHIPPGDNRPRACCDHCGAIHYVNPRVVVGTVPVWGEQVLLCRRAIEPRRNYWTLPAGFLEVDETVGAGAIRETEEEAGARIVLGPLFTMLDVVHVHQVHLFYRAELLDIDFAPGEESLEVQLFDEADIPWDELAFRTVSTTLRHFFADRQRGHYELHTAAIDWSPRSAISATPVSAVP